MKWAIGRVKERKGSLIVIANSDGIIAIQPKYFKQALSSSTNSAIFSVISNARSVMESLGALDSIAVNADSMVNSALGGGLLGMAAGAATGAAVGAAREKALEAAEQAIVNAVTESLATLLGSDPAPGETSTEVLGRFTERDVLEALSQGKPELWVPRDRIKRVTGKSSGLMTKTFELTVFQRGFWIFSEKHVLEFTGRMIQRAGDLPGAVKIS